MVKRFYCLFMVILIFLCGCEQKQEVTKDACVFYQPSQAVPIEVKGALKEDCFMNVMFDKPKDISILFTTEVWKNGVKIKRSVNKWPPDSEPDFADTNAYYSQSISLYNDNTAYINAGVANSTGSCFSWSDPIALIDMSGYSYHIYQNEFELKKREKKAIAIFIANETEGVQPKIVQENWDKEIDKLLTEATFMIVFYVEADQK